MKPVQKRLSINVGGFGGGGGDKKNVSLKVPTP